MCLSNHTYVKYQRETETRGCLKVSNKAGIDFSWIEKCKSNDESSVNDIVNIIYCKSSITWILHTSKPLKKHSVTLTTLVHTPQDDISCFPSFLADAHIRIKV